MGEEHVCGGIRLRFLQQSCIPQGQEIAVEQKEIVNLQNETKSPGFTIVPLRLFIDENGRAKLVIALCRGKKEYDKRATLKEKADRREMDRAIKRY